MRGCAIRPLIGPASQTKDVNCSDKPNESRNGVPYLTPCEQMVAHKYGVNAPQFNCPSNLRSPHGDAQINKVPGG